MGTKSSLASLGRANTSWGGAVFRWIFGIIGVIFIVIGINVLYKMRQMAQGTDAEKQARDKEMQSGVLFVVVGCFALLIVYARSRYEKAVHDNEDLAALEGAKATGEVGHSLLSKLLGY